MLTCKHCGGRQRGYATVGDAKVCHPDDGMDCYRLVTVYGHQMPCETCAGIADETTEMVRKGDKA